MVLTWPYVLVLQANCLFIFLQGTESSHQNCATLPAHVKDVLNVRKSVSCPTSCLNHVEKRHSGLQEDSVQLALIPANPYHLVIGCFVTPRLPLAVKQPTILPLSLPSFFLCERNCPLTLLWRGPTYLQFHSWPANCYRLFPLRAVITIVFPTTTLS